MRVLVDTNILLDGFLEREPFADDARTLFEITRSRRIAGYVTATTITDIFYIVRRQARSIERARQAVIDTLALMEVCSVDGDILESAIASPLTDFEDAVQLACAIANNLDAIITRDTEGFAGAIFPILSVGELLERLS
ncbi:MULTISPECIES: PIN domain-containing protein [Cyanophyceae]|uniref:PIN domain-containing protein n=1 Tax=Cyanophyceae TaxID=3028117 RepID=UPI00168524C3|nr:PIN domain-containing protein [Trichocoleus sp. FACHB-40]MBD2006082.1 PIN domain-containing protein [Trichocoleus sp. FACHB-40]